MAAVEIQLDQAKLNQIASQLASVRNGLPRVVSRGINKTLQSARTQAIRKLAARSNLRQNIVRRAITITKANYNRWVGNLRLGGRRIPLIAFNARQTRTGVSYKITDTRRTAPGAFIAVMPSGHRGVFRRSGSHRLPIYELFGPSIGGLVRNTDDAFVREIEGQAAADLIRNIDMQMKLILGKAG